MTKAIPLTRLLMKKPDGNQEDAHAPERSRRSFKVHFPLEQQQSPDWGEEGAEWTSTGKPCRPTALEELLGLELDLVLPATKIPAPMSTCNQLPASATREEEMETDVDAVSLEILAMQSPHGENQQWQSDEEEHDVDSTPSTAPARPEHSPPRKMKEMSAFRKPMPLNLMSPTSFVPSFPLSLTQSSTDDAYGLASPMTLPDTTSQTRPGIALAWNLEPASPILQDAHVRRGASHRLPQSKSVQRPDRRASSDSIAGRAATPNPNNYRNYVPGRARITRSLLPTLPEVRAKARHGGIYSLLLKNTSVKQEAVLVEDAHNPEEVAAEPSVAKASPPRKQTHGGIYKILRASHGPR